MSTKIHILLTAHAHININDDGQFSKTPIVSHTTFFSSDRSILVFFYNTLQLIYSHVLKYFENILTNKPQNISNRWY